MRSRMVACSRMIWLVNGILRAFTTRASSRSTRNWMSKGSPSSARVTIAQEQEVLLADLLGPRDADDVGHRRRMLPQHARDDRRIGCERRGEVRMRDRCLKDRDISEGWVEEHEV